MSEAVTSYHSAVEELKQAKARCEKLSAIINAAANAMSGEGWRNVMVANADANFPAAFATPGRAKIDANDWPTGQQIAEALARYHRARQGVQEAYDKIPDSEQAGVKTLDMG